MKSKKIYIEGLALVEGHFSGIGQYTLGILRGMDNVLEADKNAGKKTPKVKVIIPYDKTKRFNEFKFKHIRAKKIPISFKYASALWHRGLMPYLDVFCGRGHYVFTRFVTMPLLFSRSSVVIYDLSFELHKEYSDDKNAAFLSKGVRKSISQVDIIFTISQNAKSEIVQFYKQPKNKVIVATPAADQKYFYRRSLKEIDGVKLKYGIKNDYILALSNLEPRKNLDALVDAYCSLPEEQRRKTSLLLVGVSGWKTDKLFTKIIKLVNNGYDIIRPSEYVTDKDKPAIISGAKILVYPSHYEGFGMPPLEALACGTPVITANNSSLPEVVGRAGVAMNCDDTDALSHKIGTVLNKIDQVTNQSIIEGPLQASMFTWESSARTYFETICMKGAK